MTAKRRTAGLTLIESSLLLSVLGILLAVMVPTFMSRVSASKTAEAASQLAVLYQRSAAYYAMRHTSKGGKRISCLPQAAGPAPEKPHPDPVEVDFSAGTTPGSTTWRALGFNPCPAGSSAAKCTGVRFRYSFRPSSSGCNLENPPGEPLLTLSAEGDLDDDGDYSLFQRTARAIDVGTLAADPLLVVHDRVE